MWSRNFFWVQNRFQNGPLEISAPHFGSTILETILASHFGPKNFGSTFRLQAKQFRLHPILDPQKFRLHISAPPQKISAPRFGARFERTIRLPPKSRKRTAAPCRGACPGLIRTRPRGGAWEQEMHRSELLKKKMSAQAQLGSGVFFWMILMSSRPGLGPDRISGQGDLECNIQLPRGEVRHTTAEGLRNYVVRTL